MPVVDIQITGLNQFLADAERAGASVQPLMRAALQNSAKITQENIRHEAPHRTGALQRSVLYTVTYPTAKVTVQEKYGEYVEEGTRPHMIYPKNKKALYWKGAFSPVKSVNHPGTKANPFFSRGVERSRELVIEQFTKLMDIVVKQMAGKI